MRDGALLIGLVVGGGLLYMASRGRAIAAAGGTKATNAAYTINGGTPGSPSLPGGSPAGGGGFQNANYTTASPAGGQTPQGAATTAQTPGGKGYRAANYTTAGGGTTPATPYAGSPSPSGGFQNANYTSPATTSPASSPGGTTSA